MFKSYDIMICSVFGCFGPGLKLFHQGLAAQTIFMALEVVNGPQLQLFQFLLISLGYLAGSSYHLHPCQGHRHLQCGPRPCPFDHG